MNRKNYRITIAGKTLIVELIICSAGLLLGLTWKIYNQDKRWDNLIYPGVEVSGINLGGKTLNEAEELLSLKYINPLLHSKVNIVANDKTYILDNSELISNNNIKDAANQAFRFGKNLNPIKKSIVLQKGASKKYNIDFTYNENYIQESIKRISSDVNKKPLDASISDNNDTVKVNTDSNGYKLNEVKLEDDIKKEIGSTYRSAVHIDAPIEKTSPEITADALSGVNTKIASYITDLSSSSPARTHNVELAAKSIDGKLIKPGEIFSFNQSVGERTKDRGFEEAPVVVGYSIESGIGGGICQVSSTLYNAILQTGIDSIERTPHTLPSSYVPVGLDSAVNWDDIDYKFKNTLDYPLYIQSYIENNNLYINIYSDASLTTRKYIITSNVYDIIQADTKIINTPDLKPGETSIVQKGSAGCKVKVQRSLYENGLLIKTETISDDVYMPVTNIINAGSMPGK